MKWLSEIAKQPGFAIAHNGSDTATYIFLEPFDSFRWDISVDFSVESDRFEKWKTEILDQTENISIPHICGFFSYEFTYPLHCLPRPNSERTIYEEFPEGYFIAYAKVICSGNIETTIATIPYQTPWWPVDEIATNGISTEWQELKNVPRFQSFQSGSHSENVRFSDEIEQTFLEHVRAVKEKILDGVVYQANISLSLMRESTRDPFENFSSLIQKEPGAYASFLNMDCISAGMAIISNSPELFVRRNSHDISVAPIKGTIETRRGYLDNEDAGYSLSHSRKDNAELAMIVDLFRNDLHKISRTGSVMVRKFPKLLTLNYIHHLSAPISATLKKGIRDCDIVAALFPSGSITGAPKYTAIQAITALEGRPRGIYCGSIFAFSRGGFFSNVAIRTALQLGDKVYIQAGCGITIDSEPMSELNEAKNKVSAFLDALQ